MKVLAYGLCLAVGVVQAQNLTGFTPESAQTQAKTETQFLEEVDHDRFKIHLKTLTKHPHIAGTKANEDVRDYMVETMKTAGWDVKTYPYEVYMSTGPGESSIALVTPIRKPLNQQEYRLKEDPYSQHPDLLKGWNAYSGSGDITGEIVYANYGTKADFETLKEMGVDLSGKIVIARYGGNFRGYKAKFAEAHGAAGLIIYTDPKDSGFTRGLTFPDGVYYNESGIQRGSLLTADWTGDPLTPYEPALPRSDRKSPKRLSPEEAGLHTIPVTPIGYGSAQEILERMQGQPVPSQWQGGLSFTYRVEGGSELLVQLKVDQPKDFTKIYNVVGTLKGDTHPDEWVILGCHYDAWAFGATDPNSGTAMLLSLSETLGKMAKAGTKPGRSIMIAHWDAEEHGVIGSSEWVEQMKEELQAKAVAYINLDAAVSGKNFGVSSAPSLKSLISETTKEVDYPYTDETVYEHWSRGKASPSIGNLGGGSDHIAFYMHAGVPSLSGGASGPTLYHTNYDDFYFYKNFVDPEFQMGPTVEKVIGLMTLRLANAQLIPYDIVRYATDLEMHFENATKQVKEFYTEFEEFQASSSAISSLKPTAEKVVKALDDLLLTESLSKKQTRELNAKLLALEKSFLDPNGLPYGDWYKSLYVSTDPFSGYASWILPGIQYQIENKATDELEAMDNRYAKVITSLENKLKEILKSLE
jgi:N-acetylated-alpha-linked acidic dipeptidase